MLTRRVHGAKSLLIGAILLLASLNLHILYAPNASMVDYTRMNPLSNDAQKTMMRNLKAPAQSLDFTALRNFLKTKLMTEYGGFPLPSTSDEYINATYYGYITLYLLGEYEFLRDRIQTAFKYFYDEEVGGFREWFGGKADLDGTLWGLLLTDFINVSIEEYSVDDALRFLNNTLSEISLEDINLVRATLLVRIISRYSTRIENNNLTALNNLCDQLIDAIMSSYDPEINLFRDEKAKLSPIIQTYLALEAIKQYNITILNSTFAERIIDGILAQQYKPTNSSSKLLGGFGCGEKPTVFETGVAVEMISSISKMLPSESQLREYIENKTFWSNITAFINNSQLDNGGIAQNPYSNQADVFQSFGAIVAFLALGKLNAYMQASANIIPSKQIAIDYNGSIRAEITVKYFGKALPLLHGRATIRNLITNETHMNLPIQPEDSTYLLDITKRLALGFGNYLISVYLWKNISLTSLKLNISLYFRIGYDIGIDVSQEYISPGKSINITIAVAYYNGTPVNNSLLILHISRIASNTTYFLKKVELNGSRNVTISYEFPIDASLGQYGIYAVINDTHGYNHTFASRFIYINDTIRYDSVENSKNTYYVGERLVISVKNLTYNSTGTPIPTDANVSLEILYPKTGDPYGELEGFLETEAGTTIALINCSLPPLIPKELNVTFILVLIWDNSPVGRKSIKLFNATLAINKIAVANMSVILNTSIIPINETKLYIGETYNISVKLIHIFRSTSAENNTINVSLRNATMLVFFNYSNKSWGKVNAVYNSSLDSYICTLFIDPNLPSMQHNLTIQVFLDFNSTYINITKKLIIYGTPKIILWKAPNKVYVDEPFIASFKLICNETNKSLENVSLSANISLIMNSRNETFLIPIAYANDTYYVSFEADEKAEIIGIIFRNADSLTLLNFTAESISKARPFSIDPLTLPLAIIIISYIGFIMLRNKYLSRVSRRFLIERKSRKS